MSLFSFISQLTNGTVVLIGAVVAVAPSVADGRRSNALAAGASELPVIARTIICSGEWATKG